MAELDTKTTETKPAKEEKKLVKKESFFKTVGPKVGKFWREYKSELKKIVWSPWQQVKHNTIIVLISIVIVSAAVGLLDFAFSGAIMGLGKLI